ncbi:MAG TPA: hypothetical protein VKR30_02370 [Candidatus Limnocylindrales bacterium]|nr:hypothetical protein [Candidatus Limnocylindrales bacterium]
MSGPVDQPAPFDPGSVPIRPAKSKPGARRFLLPAVGGLVLAIASFGVGYAAANLTATPTRGDTGVNGNGGFFGPGASGRPRNGGGFAGGASGTVGSVSTNQMTITTATGSRIVLLTPQTTVTEVSAATKALTDIASGETVTVVGTANPDGSVTATRVIIGDIAALGGGRGFLGGPGASATP